MVEAFASSGQGRVGVLHDYEFAAAAVLFVDQVGSTAMLNDLGETTGLQVRDRLRTILDASVAEHGSSATTDTGDGIKAIFATPLSAVRCALDIRRDLYLVNRRAPADEHIEIRIGIHSGEMPHRFGEPDGIGVAQAARLCGIAPRGQTLVSSEVRAALEQTLSLDRLAEFTSLGTRSLKGLPSPVEIHRMYRSLDPARFSIPEEIIALRRDPFVGRDAELVTLRAQLDRIVEPCTEDERSLTVVLQARRGMGKRRLVVEFAAEIADLGFEVFWLSPDGPAPTEGCDVLIVDDPSRTDIRLDAGLRVIVEDDPHVCHSEWPVIELGPLSTSEVEMMVELATGGDELDARISADVRAAGGHPGAVRSLLDQQRAVDSTRRIRQLISVASEQHFSQTSALAGVAIGVRDRAVVGELSDDAGRAPYMGLVRFEAADAALFCGRDDLIASIVSRLAVHGHVVLSGASGSGKSSLLRAGVLHAIDRDVLPLSSEWATCLMVPGSTPVRSLAEALHPHLGQPPTIETLVERLCEEPLLLADLASEIEARTDHGVLLVVDQAEEIFTIGDEDERQAFVDLLTAATEHVGDSIRIIMAMRSDFYGRLASYGPLAAACAEHLVVIPEMNRAELEAAVVEPARRAGLSLESGLVDLVIEESEGQAGTLPLVSTAMLETWRRRDDRTLTIAGFDKAGGVLGAVRQLAEQVYESLDDDARPIARRVIVSLTEPGQGEFDTARSMRLDEVNDIEPGAAAVVEQLATARLLTIRDDTVELSHEALIPAWPRLASWLDGDRAVRRTRRLLTVDSTRWVAEGRPDDLLYRSAPLEGARSAAATTTPALDETEQEFLDASTARLEQEQAAAQVASRRLRLLVGALALALVAAVGAGGLATSQRRDASELTLRSLVSQTAELSQSVGSEDPDLAFLLAVESLDTRDTPDGRRSALSASSRMYPPNRQIVRAAGEPARATSARLFSAMFAEGAETVLVGTSEGTIELIDVETGAMTGTPTSIFAGSGVRATAMIPTGDLAIVSVDGDLSIIPPGGQTPTPVDLPASGTATDVAAGAGEFMVSTEQGSLLVVNRNGTTVRNVSLGDGSIRKLAVSNDLQTVAVGFDNGLVRIVELASGRTISEVGLNGDAVSALAMSADGSTVASAALDRSLWIWNALDGTTLAGPLDGPTREVLTLAFNPDATLLVAGASDETVRVFDTAAGAAVVDPLNELTNNVVGVTFADGGGSVVAVSEEGDVMQWTVDAAPTFEEPRALITDMTEVRNLAFSNDGALLIAVGNDGVADGRQDIMDGPTAGDPGRISIYDVASGDLIHEPTGHDGAVNWVAVHRDGLIATASHDGTIRAWDPTTGREVGAPLRGHDGPVLSLAFDPGDADRVVSSGADGTIRRWSWSRREPIGEPISDHGLEPDLAEGGSPIRRRDVVSVAFNADGTLLASSGFDYTARVYDTDTWSTVNIFGGHEGRVRDAIFDPVHENVLHTASFDKTLASWDMGTGERLAVSEGHTFLVIDLLALPDGSALVSSSWDNTVRFWNPDTSEPIGVPLTRHTSLIWRMALDPGATLLATAGQDGSILLWDQVNLDHGSIVERACARAALRENGPNLTRSEWNRYVGPAKEYRETCG